MRMIGLDGQNRTASKSFGDSCVAITLHRDGTPGRNRTCDPRLRRPLFYPLNYGRKTGAGREIRTPLLRFGRPPCNRKHFTRKTWSEMRDSNSRPSGPKPDALPDCANLRWCPHTESNCELMITNQLLYRLTIGALLLIYLGASGEI